MEEASEAMDFEMAAEYRDRIRALAAIQSHQDINVEGLKDADVVAFYQREGKSCIQVFFFRGGQNFGNRAYFPKHDPEETEGDILSNFMAQFYDGKPVPPILMISHEPSERSLPEEALSQKEGRKIAISVPSRGQRRRMLDFVAKNAKGGAGASSS